MKKKQSTPRFFNKIEYSGDAAKKSIFDLNRGKEEVYFYKNLPQREKQFFPHIKKISYTKKSITYEMEFIQLEDIAYLYTNGLLTKKKLKTLLKAIDFYWTHVQTRSVSQKQWLRISKKVILERLEKRWSQYKKSSTYKTLRVHFQEQHHLNIDSLVQDLHRETLQALVSMKETTLYRTHGDLCFSNMFLLADESVKLVDPRGGKNKHDLFIPLIYDVAKLSQCIFGNYDGINCRQNITFAPQKKLFRSWLKKKGVSLRVLRLIESSHFLSLLPLHLDKPQKHKAFLKAAIAAYTEALCTP